jgi:protein-arginine kinase activator protein McsA
VCIKEEKEKNVEKSIEQLREELEEATSKEDFETAAKLRNEIKERSENDNKR